VTDSQPAEASAPFDGVDASEWLELVEVGRAAGEVDVATIHHVFRAVDALPDLFVEVEQVLGGLGVRVVQHDDELVDITPTDGMPRPSAEELAKAERETDGVLSGLRKRRANRLAQERGVDGAGDPVRQYMREIGRVGLLSKAEETALAKAIEAGHAATARIEELQAAGQLTAAESRQLRRQQQQGEEAKEELIQANLRLVVSIAKRYMNRGGMHFLDLIQEGNLGLMRAVDKFDHSKGFKFSTYATWWIRQAITRSIADQARTIRVPVHMVETMNRVLRQQRSLVQELHREPTIEELSEHCAMAPDRLREILRIAQDPLSLDSTMGEDGDSSLADFIGDSSTASPEGQAELKAERVALRRMLKDLNERDRGVIEMRYGLAGEQPATLEDVGRAFGITRERVRQIEAKAMARLRSQNGGKRAHDLHVDD
jgi:RNA polymerase primary sigma factor